MSSPTNPLTIALVSVNLCKRRQMFSAFSVLCFLSPFHVKWLQNLFCVVAMSAALIWFSDLRGTKFKRALFTSKAARVKSEDIDKEKWEVALEIITGTQSFKNIFNVDLRYACFLVISLLKKIVTSTSQWECLNSSIL